MLNSIYLSGWEYNRVISDDPLKPLVSGLPAQVLWDGAAPFWLFETVYCTKEALEGDVAAYHDLGWTTGKMFEDLSMRGFLTPIDWSGFAINDATLRSDLLRVHALLREHYPPESIRTFLDTGKDAELEAIKVKLLSPLLRRLHCIKNVSPNSITHWLEPEATLPPVGPTATAGALLEAAILRSREGLRAGFRLCDPPGTGLSDEVRARQRDAELRIQRPLIPDLLAGTLSQNDYHRHVAVTREVYEPINAQLWASYIRNIDTMERLRDLAHLHLWPQLHNEWLPALDADPMYLSTFQSLLANAVQRSRFDPFLQFITDVAIITVSAAVGSAAGAAVGGDLVVGVATGGAVKRAFDQTHEKMRKSSESLAVFVQKARKVIKKGKK